jgi:hypothetical protein
MKITNDKVKNVIRFMYEHIYCKALDVPLIAKHFGMPMNLFSLFILLITFPKLIT